MKNTSTNYESLRIYQWTQRAIRTSTNYELKRIYECVGYKLILILTACVLMFSCNGKKGEGKKVTSSLPPKPIEKLYGNWLCGNLLDSIREHRSMVSIFDPLTLPYAYEMQFDESFGDSVFVYNGFEQFFLPVIIKHDSIILDNAIQGNPIILFYDSLSSTLKIMISRNDNYPIPSVFFKADEKYIQPNGRFHEAFISAFNEATVEGSYTLINKDRYAQGATITFNIDGSLTGYEGGIRYNCCIGGDCLDMMEHPMNTMSIIVEDKPEEYWGWHLSNDTDTLTLTKLKDANSDEPGNFIKTKIVLELVRNK
ncbi:MAG: hypothetical protein ABI723_13680 [Bacteroidia bacterium]